MKVINVMSRFNIGGTAQWLYQLSQGLDKSEIDNLLIVGECPVSEGEDRRISEINAQKIGGLGPKTSVTSTVRAFFKLRKLIKVYKPDLINTHTSKAGVIGRLAARSVSRKIAIVHTYHGHILTGYFSPILVFGIKFIEKFLSLMTDLFFISGEGVLRDLKNEGLLKSAKFMTVWPAVPDYALEDRDLCRSQLGIDLEKVVIGWHGRKVQIKRLDRVLDLSLEFPNCVFLVAGDGPSIKETFVDKFRDYAFENVVELGLTSPSKVWAIADICMLTSDNEAMPIAPIEAALARKSVVVVNAGASAEVLVNQHTGFLCSGEISALADHLRLLVNDPYLREKMGTAGRQHALDRFSPDNSIARQIEGYRKALASKILH